jgi:hypothetical protein
VSRLKFSVLYYTVYCILYTAYSKLHRCMPNRRGQQLFHAATQQL